MPVLLAWDLGHSTIVTAGEQLVLRHVTHVDQQLWVHLAAYPIRVQIFVDIMYVDISELAFMRGSRIGHIMRPLEITWVLSLYACIAATQQCKHYIAASWLVVHALSSFKASVT